MSARIFHTVFAAIVVTGVPASFDPTWERWFVTGWIVAGVLAAMLAVAIHVAAEIRWNREMDAVIAVPVPTTSALATEMTGVATAMATDLAAR